MKLIEVEQPEVLLECRFYVLMAKIIRPFYKYHYNCSECGSTLPIDADKMYQHLMRCGHGLKK